MDQRTWVITGAAGGIGSCLVKYLVKHNQKVYGLDVNNEGISILQDEIQSVLFTPVVCNLGYLAQLDAAITTIKEQTKSVDVLIHNAVLHQKGMLETSFDEMSFGLQVNVVAPMYLTKMLVPLFSANASVINILSTRANQSQIHSENYAAAKGALSSLTHAMMMTLSGISRVNAVAPGWIDTSICNVDKNTFTKADHLQHPSQSIGAPIDIIKAIMYLTDPTNGFINGQIITVDGGMSKTMIYHNDYGWTYHSK